MTMKKNTISKIIIKTMITKRAIIQYTKNLTQSKTNTFSKMKTKRMWLNKIIMKDLLSKITNNNKSLYKMKSLQLKISSKNQININYLRKKVYSKKIDNPIKNFNNMNKNHNKKTKIIIAMLIKNIINKKKYLSQYSKSLKKYWKTNKMTIIYIKKLMLKSFKKQNKL